jgi:glycosyltransferase involved in cell wall biosynthesis
MNVLHIIGSMDPVSGGPCQGIRNSINSLAKQIDVREVVSLDDPAASFLGQDAFPVHALGPGKGPWRYSSRLTPWLEENLCRFDVVIINGLWLYHSYAVSKAVKCYRRQQKKTDLKSDLRVFIMSHGMLDPYFQRAPERKLKAIRNWVYWKLIEAGVVKRADGLLFTSETEMRLAREPFSPYQPKKEINVGYGIEAPPSFTAQMKKAFFEKCPEARNHPFLLFLSRIHPKKGVDILIKAYASVLNENSNVEEDFPHLVIAGPGLNTDYGQKMQNMVAENPKLRSKVFFPGMLSGDAKWGAFYGCEAFILPSHQENFGIAVAEALACSKPVLISKEVNIWQEIKKEDGGIIGDDTLEGIFKLLKVWMTLSKEQKQVMQGRAYIAYQKHFEISEAANKFLQAIST